MLLEKAREIIALNLREGSAKMPPDCKTALYIAIPAIDRILQNRKHGLGKIWTPLPGETRKE